ncbi:MAG: type VI secretion system secreted protein VgrG [Colwellia sp.]|jgi:type VI secretion system secreted protein VgrG
MSDQHRLVAISTPLKDDVLILREAKYQEHLGKPFEMDVELVSTDESVSFEEILGKNVTVRLETNDEDRYFNGIVTVFKQKESFEQHAVYCATVRPWLWLLSLSQHCRIYQQKSYPEIIKSVFDDMDFSDYEDRLTGKYDKQEYVVQFNETDLDFVTRIMQQEGIFYFFKHTNGKHTLILQDDTVTANNLGEVPYFELKDHSRHKGVEGITQWENHQQVKTGGISLSSYDFQLPTKNLTATTLDPKVNSLSSFQKYTYEGNYSERAAGDHYTKMLMEQENATQEQKAFSGNMRILTAGANFTLTEHMRDDQNANYYVTQFSCVMRSDELMVNVNKEKSFMYEFSACAIPAKCSFRPEISVRKPVMQGPQTATVVGKTKEEIWTDKYGRIKVHFHWDKQSKSDELSSCWMRVSQSMAGKNWGSIYIPRVGQEVIVDFLQGDPDQPVVIGCVYNGSSLPPHSLPNNATFSGFKSRSTKNGGQFNELRFDDKQGEEQLFIHAAKNQDIMVNNDCFETVGSDRHLTVKQDQFVKVENNRFEDISADHIEKIGKDFNLNIVGKEAKEVGESLSLKVNGDSAQNYESNLSINVNDDTYIKSDSIVLEASSNITLQVGNSFISIDKGGIKICSPGNVVVESKANVNIDAGAKAEFSAGGPVSISGAIVNLN